MMRRAAKAFVLATVLLVAAACAPALATADDFGPLALRDLQGNRTSLAALRGKVVVLNFWATWCRPCVEEMPILADLAERYGDRGLVVVAASVDDAASRGEIERFAAKLPDSMRVWIGATLEDMERLELGMSVPVTVVLDRDGDVAERQRGTLSPGALDAKLERLLRGGGGSPEKKTFDAVEAGVPGPRATPVEGAEPLTPPDGACTGSACA